MSFIVLIFKGSRCTIKNTMSALICERKMEGYRIVFFFIETIFSSILKTHLNRRCVYDITMIVIPLSTVDEIGKISRTVFIGGCNFNCPFCQNYDLINRREKILKYADLVLKDLSESSVIDCIVVSGGEPLLNDEIVDFLVKLKESGKELYLNTNGYFTDRLKEVMPLLEGVSMDVKSSFSRYGAATGLGSIGTEPVKKSMEWLIDHHEKGFKVEFRTTMVDPVSVRSDVIDIASFLASRCFSGYYALQQVDMSNVKESNAGKMKMISTSEMMATAKCIKDMSFKVFIRTLDRGIVKFFQRKEYIDR